MIRIAKQSEYAELDAICRRAAYALCMSAYDVELIDAWVAKPRLEKYFSDNGNTYFVLIREDRIACYGAINLGRQLLEALFVEPEFAGQGLGHEMLEYLFQQAATAGMDTLLVESSLNAVGFYQQHGFIEYARGKFQLSDTLALDSVLMRCRLTLPR